MTYQEIVKRRAEILFTAAAELYKLAAVINVEDGHDQTWTDVTENLGHQVEDLGHEQGAPRNTRGARRLAGLRAAVKTTENRRLKAAILDQLR